MGQSMFGMEKDNMYNIFSPHIANLIVTAIDEYEESHNMYGLKYDTCSEGNGDETIFCVTTGETIYTITHDMTD